MLTVLKKIPKRIDILVREKRVVRYLSTQQTEAKKASFEEVKIPVPWGHIAGKRWGIKNLKPVLCIHGWQDNANTFDELIPLLPNDYCYVAIDLPGHGLSSHIPPGMFYTPVEYLSVIRRVQLHFKWSSFALMGHSLGSACAFVFASCFPSDIYFFVAIDHIKPLSVVPSEFLKSTPIKIEKMLACDSRTAKTAPLYTENELIQKWIEGSNKSLTEKSCRILMQRGVEYENGKCRLRRDCRVKLSTSSTLDQKDIVDMARKLDCSILYIKSNNSPIYEKKELIDEVIKTIKTTVKHYEEHELPGTHHIHLNNPEVVAPVISNFITSVEKH